MFFSNPTLQFEKGLDLKAEALKDKYMADPSSDVITGDKGKPEMDTDISSIVPALYFSPKFIVK